MNVCALPARLLALPNNPRRPVLARNPVYIATLAATIVVAAAVGIPPLLDTPPEGLDLILVGSVLGCMLALTSVSLSRRDATHWSATGFIALTQTFALGPWGALFASLGLALGAAIRVNLPDIRTLFNLANFYLSNLGAWAIYASLEPRASGWVLKALVAALAGGGQFAVNLVILGMARWASDPHTDMVAFVRGSMRFAPYNLGYGWAALGGVLLYTDHGTLAVSSFYVPIILVQVFLISMARRIEAEEREEAEHARERERLLERVRIAAEVERGRIVRDLHDGVVQDLAALTSGLRTRADQTDDAEGARVLVRAADAASDAMTELRTLLREIAPPDLEETGLKTAIDVLLEPLQEEGVVCASEVDGDVDGTDALRPIFRIAQEAVRNVVKHAQAHSVQVTASVVDHHVVLEVRDDGLGYDSERARQRRVEGHIGVQLLHDLAAEAGGTLSIESAPGEGTVVRASVPVGGRN